MLGAAAAQRLGIDRVYPGERVWLGGMWFYVTGILTSAALAPEIDSSRAGRLSRRREATSASTATRPRSTSAPITSQTAAVQSVLAATANPENPNEVNVSQPSAALTARADAQGALNGLFLGLGAVSLLVGAVGVANIMIISRARTPLRDRAAPRARRDQGPHPHAVPLRSDPARPARRDRRRQPRGARDRGLRPHQALGDRDPDRSPGREVSAPRSRSAPSPASCRRSAPPGSRPPKRCAPSRQAPGNAAAGNCHRRATAEAVSLSGEGRPERGCGLAGGEGKMRCGC